MVYRVFSKSREYLLTGTPGIDLKVAFKAFLSKLSRDKAERERQLTGVLAAISPEEKPQDDIETQVFIRVAENTLNLQPRALTEVNLWSDSIQALIG